MNDDYKLALKAKLRLYCILMLRERLDNAEALINAAQESANNESKSSAGDKYETARAMGQIQKDMYLKQAQVIRQELLVAETTAVEIHRGSVKKGTVVLLNGLTIFICVGLGKKKIEEEIILFVSMESPLFKDVQKKQTGDHVNVDRSAHVIDEIF
jgi:hypothetical protein